MRVFNSLLTARPCKFRRSSAGSTRRPFRKRKHVRKAKDEEFDSERSSGSATKSSLLYGTSKMPPVMEPAEEEGKEYLIVTKKSRKYKSVDSVNVATSRYPEVRDAAFADAANLLEEVLGTSCCSQKNPYGIYVSSSNIFYCVLSKAEFELLKEHEDVEIIDEHFKKYNLICGNGLRKGVKLFCGFSNGEKIFCCG